jgi:DNA-binding IclR family transcriptional regulator
VKIVKREKAEYAVQSVNNAIDILELLSNADGELSVSDIGLKLGLTKNNTSKILSTLEIFGYVECNRYTGSYRLGVKTFQISQAYLLNMSLFEVSKGYLEAIRNRLNETSYVSVFNDGNIVYLNSIETRQAVRVRLRIGLIRPAYASASGKVHLANMELENVKALYENKMQKFTENTINSIDALIKELESIKKKGYAVDNEEFEREVISVAAPVHNFMGRVIGALSTSIPSIRCSKDRIEKEIAPVILEYASDLSKKYGYKI